MGTAAVGPNYLRLDRLGASSSSQSTSSSLNALQCFSLVNCNVIGFVTLDEVLGFVLRRVVDIAFELNIGNNFPHDDATNSTCLRIPFNVITAFESLRHLA